MGEQINAKLMFVAASKVLRDGAQAWSIAFYFAECVLASCLSCIIDIEGIQLLEWLGWLGLKYVHFSALLEEDYPVD